MKIGGRSDIHDAVERTLDLEAASVGEQTGEKAGKPAIAGEGVDAIFEAHAVFVWRTLARMGVHEDDVPDLLQDVFVVVQRKLSSFDRTARITTWLFAIAARVVANHRRALRRRRDVYAAAAPTAHGESSEDPETIAARHELRTRLTAALDRLAPEHRAVFVMFELEGLSGEEIARELDVPLGTIHSRLYNARKRLLAALQSHLLGDR